MNLAIQMTFQTCIILKWNLNIEFPFQRSLPSWFSEFVEQMLEGGTVFCEIAFPGTCLNRVQIPHQTTKPVSLSCLAG